MSKSLLSDEKKCYICESTLNLHKHHCFGGHGIRQLSEKWGCWVYLCADHHNLHPTYSVHNNRTFDLLVKRACQKAWEEKYGSLEEFIKIFNKSYL